MKKIQLSGNRYKNKPVKGVYLCKTTGRWRAEIKKEGKRYRLGRYNDIIDAANAYDKAALELFGEFALTNDAMGGN